MQRTQAEIIISIMPWRHMHSRVELRENRSCNQDKVASNQERASGRERKGEADKYERRTRIETETEGRDVDEDADADAVAEVNTNAVHLGVGGGASGANCRR